MKFAPWGALIFGTFRGGVYSSPDSGVTWDSIGLRGTQWAGPVACTPGGAILVGSNDGLYRTTDRGATWNLLFPNSDGLHAFLVEPDGRLIVGLNGRAYFTLNPWIGITSTTDGGLTWTERRLTKHAIVGLQRDANGILYAGTDGGVHRSTDGGQTWCSVGIAGFPTMSLASLSDGTIYAGDDMDAAVYCSTDRGDSWSRVAWGLSPIGDGGEIMELAANSRDHIFASTYAWLCRSTNRGATWQRLLPEPIHQVTFNQQGFGFAASIRDAGAIGGVFFSPDSGASWARVAYADFDVYTVATNGPLVLGGAAAGVWRSTDLGQTWMESDSGLATKNVRWIFIDTCRVHISYGLTLAGTWGSGMYRSRNTGITWEPCNSGISGNRIVKIVGDLYGDIVAVSDSGAFVWQNNDSAWHPLVWPFTSASTNLMITPDRQVFVSPYGVNLQRSTAMLTAARLASEYRPSGSTLY
ncbi:MAG TPA: hypothetical protein VMM80_08385, partial [Bacteroidota bacterium]|nr:hypothetical protein [Bacteroidota bacterium]